jgi:paired amphipathic helix protein Sin3a
VLTIQLLGKGDTTVDDAVTTQEKWQQYIDSYTLVSSFSSIQYKADRQTHPTEGLGKRVKGPFLKRNLENLSVQNQADQLQFKENLQLKVALGSYLLFFVPGTRKPIRSSWIMLTIAETEDYFHRSRPLEELQAFNAKEAELQKTAGDEFRGKFEREI